MGTPNLGKGKRYRYKQWRNGPSGQETARITWWQEEGEKNIRLECQDWYKGHNFYPPNEAEATQIFNRFQMLSPAYNSAEAKSKSPVELLLDLQRKDATDGKKS